MLFSNCSEILFLRLLRHFGYTQRGPISRLWVVVFYDGTIWLVVRIAFLKFCVEGSFLVQMRFTCDVWRITKHIVLFFNSCSVAAVQLNVFLIRVHIEYAATALL